jgi:hypothetical protein
VFRALLMSSSILFDSALPQLQRSLYLQALFLWVKLIR